MTWLPRKTIVVPIDFSEKSFAALDAAREMADDPTSVHAIHVLPVLEPTEPGVIWDTVDDAGRVAHATKALSEALAKHGSAAAQTAVRFGDPGSQIARYAEQVGAGLVIISSHGRSALKRILIGSVAERVVRLIHCPVLVLK